MSHRTPFVLFLIVVLLALTVGAAFVQSGATKQVGIVVSFVDGTTHTELVTVPASATTVDVLKAAKLDVVTAESSFGPAVCQINATGCPADNCFCDAKNFWAYYHLDGMSWTGALEGVGAYVPADRAVEGFAWSGSDANFNPTLQPTVVTFDQMLANQAPRMSPLQIGALVLLVVAVAALVWYVRRLRRRAV